MRVRTKELGLWFMACLGVAGCGDIQVAPTPAAHPMPVTLGTAGASIAEVHGWFTVDATKPITADWRSDCPLKPTTVNFGDLTIDSGHTAGVVKITYPGLSVPLYGLLSLCEFPSDYSGAASRSYRLEIPKDYVDATDGGRVSVVFEPYDYGGGERVAWALWLSRDPTTFAKYAGQPTAPTAPAK